MWAQPARRCLQVGWSSLALARAMIRLGFSLRIDTGVIGQGLGGMAATPPSEAARSAKRRRLSAGVGLVALLLIS